MTQIISAITEDYAILVADRRITSFETGEVLEDDSCKMVNIQSTCSVAYTGISKIEGVHTHEWIAITLAKARCTQIGDSMPVLLEAATVAFRSIPKERSRHTFVFCGWSAINGYADIRPCMAIVTNSYDDSMKHLKAPGDAFVMRLRYLARGEGINFDVQGQPLRDSSRYAHIETQLRSLSARSISPNAATRLLAHEIHRTSGLTRSGVHHEGNPAVGPHLLTMCIPRIAAERTFIGGDISMTATDATLEEVTFSHFDPERDEELQYGPAGVYRGFATGPFEGRSKDGSQSAGFKFLYMPNAK
jgi:hypothetical protein